MRKISGECAVGPRRFRVGMVFLRPRGQLLLPVVTFQVLDSEPASESPAETEAVLRDRPRGGMDRT